MFVKLIGSLVWGFRCCSYLDRTIPTIDSTAACHSSLVCCTAAGPLPHLFGDVPSLTDHHDGVASGGHVHCIWIMLDR